MVCGLAGALNMPPALLLCQGYPDEKFELLPGLDVAAHEAVDWLSGARLLPAEITDDGTVRIRRSNPGVELVGAVAAREDLQRRSFPLVAIERAADSDKSVLDEDTRQALKEYKVQRATINQKIDETRTQLWGSAKEKQNG